MMGTIKALDTSISKNELKKNSVPLPAVIFEQQNVLTHDSFSHEQKTILLDAQILFEQKFPVLTQKIKNAGTKEEKIALVKTVPEAEHLYKIFQESVQKISR